MPRLFTLSQARRSLPEIAAVVTVMRKRALRLDELSALSASMSRTTSADGDPVINEDSEIRAEMSKLEGQIATLIEHIQRQGWRSRTSDAAWSTGARSATDARSTSAGSTESGQ